MFWLHVEYVGIPWIPSLWILLVRRHCRLRTPIALLFVIPFITLAAEWTNSLHGLYDISVTLVPRDPFWIVAVHRGPLAWLHLSYHYVALLYGAVLCLLHMRASSDRSRFQGSLFAAVCLPPLAGYSIYLCGWSPWGLDLAPLMLCASLIAGYLLVFRLECFDLVPMARSLVFNSMRDAVLVTDPHHRLVDFNPAARMLLPALRSSTLGCDVADVFHEAPSVEDIFHDTECLKRLELVVDGEKQHFEMHVFPLGAKDLHVGWAIIVANITAQLRVMHQLQRHAETDALTGIANRRGFSETMERENARCQRHTATFSVLLIDVDHFKSINDSHGHAAGDNVLRMVAERIGSCLRTTDLLSRYGGDEFAALLPETQLEGAEELAERIRAAVVECPVTTDGQSIELSISIGVAAYVPEDPVDPKKLMKQADRALYCAKSDGRNRIAVWSGVAACARISSSANIELLANHR